MQVGIPCAAVSELSKGQLGEQVQKYVLVLIRNIPSNYHSCDLRSFFSSLIERGAFICFHFRHRPEKKEVTDEKSSSDSKTSSCCLVKIHEEFAQELFQSYSGKNWLDEKDQIISARCHVIRVKYPSSSESGLSCESLASKYATRSERRIEARYHNLHNELRDSDLKDLIEFNPPPLMPQGNVGTPTSHFLNLINNCQMPSRLIKQLGLQFPKGRKNRRYGKVEFNYGDDFASASAIREDQVYKRSCNSSSKTSLVWFEKRDDREDADDDLDNDECEEWERHEALNDDVTTHERNKATLFEDEAEVVWEKGGPGIVWNTDANFWKAQNGGDDLDEATDDWDVDMALYYGEESEGRGDKDARDFIQMSRESNIRKGETESVFRTKDSADSSTRIGKFEKHTKGVGRRLLEKHGWKEGSGIGKWKEGLADALVGEGQLPYIRKGLGFYGSVLQRKLPKNVSVEFSQINRQAMLEPGNSGVRITTCFDEKDPGDSLKRRKTSNNLSYRNNPGSL